MTGEEMERAIEFLINHHAKVSSDIEGLKEAQVKTATKSPLWLNRQKPIATRCGKHFTY